MSKNVKNVSLLLAGVLSGAVITGVFYPQLMGNSMAVSVAGSDEAQPLYWVAPMDPNYRRDQPGKSPMGMDLVPVYEEGSATEDSGPGTIKISPEVVNNLGVRTVAASLGQLEYEVRTVGYVDYNQDRFVDVHPRIDGWIEQLYIKAEGETVTEGQPLYTLYSPALVNAQEEYLFALKRKNRQLISAAGNRLRALQVPDELLSDLKANGKVRETVTFYAPQSGVVTNFLVRQGMFVKPGMKLMSIGDLGEVWLEAQVFESQAGIVRTGLPVTIMLDYLPGQELKGVVDYVYPVLDAATRTLKVRMRFSNPDMQLKPNMFAEVVIYSHMNKRTLNVPQEAVIRTGGKDRLVLALGDGRFKSIEVQTGRTDGKQFEILNGLLEGDRIVTSAQFLLDSESSKSSDFKRMYQEEKTEQPVSVWAEATFNQVNADKVNLMHGEIAAWKWPAMTMDFGVAESVDLNGVKPGTYAHVEITKQGNNYLISGIHIPEQTTQADMNHEGMNHGDMNHEGMNHGEMNHEEMNHEEMNHGEMNQGEMNQGEMNQGEMNHEGMNHGEMNQSEMNHGEMNHGEMNHGEMNHSEMNHGEMNQGEMNHGEMNHGEMNQGEMNHGEMNQGEMNHGEMNHGEMNQGEMNQGEMNHGEMNQGEMNQGEMNQGEMNQGEMNQGEMNHGEMNHGEMNHDGMNHGSLDLQLAEGVAQV